MRLLIFAASMRVRLIILVQPENGYSYCSDYGFHTGNILWRVHFVAARSRKSSKLGSRAA